MNESRDFNKKAVLSFLKAFLKEPHFVSNPEICLFLERNPIFPCSHEFLILKDFVINELVFLLSYTLSGLGLNRIVTKGRDTYRFFLRETIKSFKIRNSFGSFRTSLRMISSSSLRELLLFTSSICPVPYISHLILNPCSSFSLRITSIGRCLALPLTISLKLEAWTPYF